MGFSRKVTTGTCTSRVAVTYRAEFVGEERIKLTLDSHSDTGICRLRIYDPTNKVVAERVVRQVPTSIEFTAKATGRYEMELANVDGNQAKRVFTWSDWDRDFTGSSDKAGQLPEGIIAIAFLTVT
jgi:hypothetical protein